MNSRRLVAASVLALLGPLPLPHVDSYQPLALGLYAAAASYGVLSVIAGLRGGREHPR